MKKGFLMCSILLLIFSAHAQEKKKDTIVKTEVVNIVTKYNPKIADVKKINNSPSIQLLEKSDKKKLQYSIFSAPVASTFIPKSGVVKGINLGVKERVYNNYLAAGYGNYASPYAELFIYKNTRFDNEFGVHLKYNASEENVRNTVLNSNFLNFNAATFFKQETRYFDWKVGLNAEINKYNWYGLPSSIVFSPETVSAIDEAQNFNYFKLTGALKFHDSNIDFVEIETSYFTDNFESKEVLVNLDTKIDLPLYFLKNDLSIKTGVEFLNGAFNSNYTNASSLNYNITTLNILPSYKMDLFNVSISAGFKTFISLDTENDVTNYLIFPDVFIATPVYKKYVSAYGGVTGNLNTNTYKNFTEENPYVSPTLFITQTAETANFFVGFKGNITRDLTYNIKASSKIEEDKPLFLRNNSKSNGNTTFFNGATLKGFEYGNSFGVFYDDVKTNSIFAEVEYLLNKNLTFSSQLQFDDYTTTNALENWNLPSLQSSLLTKYKAEKWYATATLFYVNERLDALYSGTSSSNIVGIDSLGSFTDLNLNGGYHFNDKFSAFLRLNNILNTEYQRFANFNTQGFQILGGITFKFDF